MRCLHVAAQEVQIQTNALLHELRLVLSNLDLLGLKRNVIVSRNL